MCTECKSWRTQECGRWETDIKWCWVPPDHPCTARADDIARDSVSLHLKHPSSLQADHRHFSHSRWILDRAGRPVNRPAGQRLLKVWPSSVQYYQYGSLQNVLYLQSKKSTVQQSVMSFVGGYKYFLVTMSFEDVAQLNSREMCLHHVNLQQRLKQTLERGTNLLIKEDPEILMQCWEKISLWWLLTSRQKTGLLCTEPLERASPAQNPTSLLRWLVQ